MTYWPEGLPRSLHYPDVTVGDLNASAAHHYGSRVAVVDGEEQLSFAELHRQACAFAQALRAAGVREGDVVMLHLPNCVWYFVGYFGILLAGGVVLPTNPLQPVHALRGQLADTGARAALTHPAHAASLLEARAGSALTTVIVVPPTAAAPSELAAPTGDGVLTLPSFLAGHDAQRPADTRRPEDLAHIAYTGGTTGTPKGVRVLHRNVVANVAQMVGWRAGHAVVRTEDGLCELQPFPAAAQATVLPGAACSIVVSPLYHAQALLNANFLLLCGATLVVAGRFSPDGMLELVERYRATYLTGSPTMFHGLLRALERKHYDVGSVRVIASGAAPIERVVLDSLRGVFPNAMITEGWGLTEGTCAVSAMPALRGAEHRLGSVGIPMFDTEVEVRAGDGRALGPGERGELWVHGPQVTDGYLHDPDATAQQFIHGWLATGDVGHRDDDGFLYISDRAKDMLIYKGYNVYPRELEDILATHPGIDVAAVVGRPDDVAGQVPVAFVVPRSGARVDPDDVLAYVAERVLPYQKVREVHVVATLPVSPAGKVRKAELRVQLTAVRDGGCQEASHR